MILIKISPDPLFSLLRPTIVPSLLFAALILLAGCATTTVSTSPAPSSDDGAQLAREAALRRDPDWGFSGRLALSQGANGGTVGIVWRQQGPDLDVRLTAPITRQSWRLTQVAGLARLEGLDGGVRSGPDAESLLWDATGWRIPVAAMSAWVRGARSTGSAEASFDPQSLPATLREQGWSVEYRGWFGGQLPLPQKVFATQGDASVRLAIERWEP